MPTINIHGIGGPRGAGGTDPHGLNDLWRKLLSNPNMATQREFLLQMNMLLPNNLFERDGSGGMSGLNFALARANLAGFKGGGGIGGAASLTAAGGALTSAAAALSLAAQKLMATGGAGGAGGGARTGTTALPGPFGRAHRLRMRGLGAFSQLAGLVGLGAVGEALGPLAAIGAAGYEAVRIPNQIAGLEGKFYNESKPYMAAKRGAFRLGRAGGYGGNELLKELFPGEDITKMFSTPPWMSFLGLRGTEAVPMLQNLGIVPTSAREARGFLEQLRRGQLAPAFAGLSGGLTTSLARQGMALGIGNRPDTMLSLMSSTMTEAIQKGIDRASILRTFQGSLGRIAQGSMGLGMGQMIDFWQRLMASGLPGGRTGQLQAQAVGGMEQRIGQIGSNPVVSMTLMNAISRHGMLRTNRGIASVIGGSNFASLEQTDAGKRLIEDIKATAGTAAQLQFVRAALQGNPAQWLKLTQGAYNFGNTPSQKALSDLVTANVSGAGIAATLGFGSKWSSLRKTNGNELFLGNPSFVAGNFDQTRNYAEILKRAGVPSDLAGGIIKAAQKYGFSPIMMAALSSAESGWRNIRSKPNRNGTIDYGAFQLNSDWLKAHGFTPAQAMNPALAPLLAAAHMQESISHGQNAITGYNPHGHEQEKVRNALMRHFLPEDVYQTEASMNQAELAASAESFKVFARHIDAVNSALSTFAGIIGTITHALGGGSAPQTKMPTAGGPM